MLQAETCQNHQTSGSEISGMYVESFVDGKEEIEGLQERITGRFSCPETIKNKDGETSYRSVKNLSSVVFRTI